MKKRLLSLLLAVLLLAALVPAVHADSETTLVYDLYGALSDTEREDLQQRAAEISGTYSFNVYIVVVDDYHDYSSYSNVEDAAEDIYRNNGLGYGEEQAGIMLLLSMAERDYDICAYSDFGHYAFTDYGKGRLADEFLDDFRHNDWYSGFRDYLGGCESLLRRAAEGNPLDVSGGGSGSYSSGRGGRYEPGTAVAIGLFVGVLAALIICMILRGRHKTVKKAVSAGAYTVPDSLDLQVVMDQFTHATQTRVKIESDSRGGGGGTHISSGGFSHSSGKF